LGKNSSDPVRSNFKPHRCRIGKHRDLQKGEFPENLVRIWFAMASQSVEDAMDHGSVSVLNDIPAVAVGDCPVACPRHQAMWRLSRWVIGWLVAAMVASFIAILPGESHNSYCGIWGCWPPFPALAGMHLLWCAPLGAAIHLTSMQRNRWPGKLGGLFLLVGLVSAVVVVSRDLPAWLAPLSVAQRELWPRRVFFTLMTTTDLPIIPLMVTGLIACGLSRRIPRTSHAPRALDGDVAVLAVAIGAVLGMFALSSTMVAAEPARLEKIPAPEFTGITDWVNTKPIKIANQRGKVVVLHFWTNGCINCVHNYPHYRDWQAKYGENKDWLMIGVHTPEFDSEKDLQRIQKRMAENKLTFAVAVDNMQATWNAWSNQFWPCIYLVDKAGLVRHRWNGELGKNGFEQMTAAIDTLLKEPPPVAQFPGRGKALDIGTPEGDRVERSNADWKTRLPADVYRVARESHTERPFSSSLHKNKAAGSYHCACCDQVLFRSTAKFDSGTGWPSYFQPASKSQISTFEDRELGVVRVEVACSRCDAHLGHVFDDGPRPTGLRYCINAVALKFVPSK
jgi:methionine-R-sulfoxide reductase